MGLGVRGLGVRGLGGTHLLLLGKFREVMSRDCKETTHNMKPNFVDVVHVYTKVRSCHTKLLLDQNLPY